MAYFHTYFSFTHIFHPYFLQSFHLYFFHPYFFTYTFLQGFYLCPFTKFSPVLFSPYFPSILSTKFAPILFSSIFNHPYFFTHTFSHPYFFINTFYKVSTHTFHLSIFIHTFTTFSPMLFTEFFIHTFFTHLFSRILFAMFSPILPSKFSPILFHPSCSPIHFTTFSPISFHLYIFHKVFTHTFYKVFAYPFFTHSFQPCILLHPYFLQSPPPPARYFTKFSKFDPHFLHQYFSPMLFAKLSQILFLPIFPPYIMQCYHPCFSKSFCPYFFTHIFFIHTFSFTFFTHIVYNVFTHAF